MEKTGEQRKYGHRIAVRPDQPALTQIRKHKNVVRIHKENVRLVIDALDNIRFLDPMPDLMRKPAFPGQIRLGDNGENLPTVLKDICTNPKHAAVFHEWARELTPMDVASFGLAMIGDDTFSNTSVVCRLSDTDDAVIRPVRDFPDSKKLRLSQGLGRLHASGWMEDALAFTGEDEERAE